MATQIIIVSQHQAVIEWIKQEFNMDDEVTVLTQVTSPEQIAGAIVIGTLPPHLAASTKYYGALELPDLPAELHGQELTVQQMRDAGCTINWYRHPRRFFSVGSNRSKMLR